MLNKDLKVQYIRNEIQEAINALDKNKIHILYFSYYSNFHNIWNGPLMLATKLYNKLLGQPSIDHVAHICKFRKSDENSKNWDAWIFEASMNLGMRRSYLFDRLFAFQGVCYIETLDKEVDKIKAKKFEETYTDVPYSKEGAAFSGIDIKWIDKLFKPKKDKDSAFCSKLEALFLKDQGVDISKIEDGEPNEITPTDLYKGNLGNKRILFKF